MKITDIRPTTVTVPLEAPIRHANGAHWGRFVRTIVEVDTDEGITGLGELGGGGESAEAMLRGLKSYLAGHDVFALEAMRFKICNPTASLYNNRTQLHAAIEFACLDIIGRKLGVPEFGRGIEDIANDYFEDPVWGMPQLARPEPRLGGSGGNGRSRIAPV